MEVIRQDIRTALDRSRLRDDATRIDCEIWRAGSRLLRFAPSQPILDDWIDQEVWMMHLPELLSPSPARELNGQAIGTP
jgi:hypothetical protein